MADSRLFVPGVIWTNGHLTCRSCGAPVIGHYSAALGRLPIYRFVCQGDGCRAVSTSENQLAGTAIIVQGEAHE